jgi:putative ABC transport system permease protein
MLGFALSTLRSRKGGFAGAFVALFCAAALVCACGMLLETGLRGTVQPERYAAAPIIVSGDQNVHQTIRKDKGGGKVKVKKKAKPLSERVWVPASLVDRLRSVPGVRSAVGELTFPAYVSVGGRFVPGSDFWGHAWESAALTPFTLGSGRAPSAAGEVVIDVDLAHRAGLSVGSRIIVQATGAPAPYTVVGVTAQALGHQSALFFSSDEARRLAGRPGLVSAIGVFPDRGIDLAQVASALTGTTATVHSGSDRGRVEFLDAEKARVKLISVGGALGGTSLLVAILVVVGTFALSIQQRSREIALLRAVAATPRQIRKMIGGEALVVGVVAGLLGSAAGVGLAFWLRTRFVAYGAMPATLDLVLSPFPLFAAVLTTVLAAWVAARVSARRTARIKPVEALGDAALQPPRLGLFRTLAGLVSVGGAVTLTLVLTALTTEPASTPVTLLTVVVWSVAVALLGPVIARVAVAVLGVPLRLFRVGGHLATANLRAGARRLAGVITPLSLMVAMACAILFVQDTMGHAAAGQARAGNLADHTLSAAGPGVPGAAADAVRKVRGVTAVTEVVHTVVRVGLTKYGAQGVTPAGLGHTMDLGVRSGSLSALGADTVAVSTTAASSLGVRVGDRMKLTLGDGTPADLRVAALYERGLGFGDLTMSHDLVAAHVDDPLSSAVLIAAPAVSPDALAAAVHGYPGVRLLDRAAVNAGLAAQEQANAEVNYVAMGLVIAFTAIAAINALAMATADRTREFALLRLVGTTRRQILRMLRWETLTVVLIAVALGTGIALLTLTAFSVGMTGSAAPYVPPATYLTIVAFAAALALVATVLPARLALRTNPADAIGARE